MVDLIISIIIVAILASAMIYIYKSKARGIKCIGCPDSKTCALKSAKFEKALDEYRKDRCCSK